MSTFDINIRNLVENVRNDVQVEYNLSELKLALGSLNSSQLSEITAGVQLGFVFDCLNSSNKSQVLTTCDILSLVLSIKPSQVVLSDYAVPLKRALGHPVKEVKDMVLKEFIRGVGENEMISILHKNVIDLIINCLCDEELYVGTRAIEFLTKLGQTSNGLKVICRDIVVKELLMQTDRSDIYKLRMYQVLVDISVYSPESLGKIETSGLFSGLIQQLRSDDVLANMASLEVIIPLVATIHGYDFLVRNDIIDLLARQIASSEDNPISSLVYPGLAKFFGHVGREFPERLITSYPDVLHEVFKGVDSRDVNVSIVSLETLAFIVYSPNGKDTINKREPELMVHVMKKLHESITKLPTEWRVRALSALANILYISVDFINNDVTNIVMSWFDHLGLSALHSIYEMARQPFPDIKEAAFNVIDKLAAHSWGQIKIANHPYLFEFLLDRTTETTLEGKQAKYDILKTLYNSPTISSTFQDDQCDRMALYLQEGVIYVPIGNQVAVEGAD